MRLKTYHLLLLPVALLMAILANQTVYVRAEASQVLPVYPEKKEQNSIKQNGLMAEYGQEKFNACFSCAELNPVNPFAFAACLRLAEYCLTGKEVKNRTCQTGYSFSAGTCVAADEGCQEQFGAHSYFTGEIDGTRKYVCGCAEGFSWNIDHSQCGITACPDNMIYYSQYRTETGEFLYGRCQAPIEACQSEYGAFSAFIRTENTGEHYCGCADGYEFSASGKTCESKPVVAGIESSLSEIIYSETIEREGKLVYNVDHALSRRLSGRILLQAEENGEAWYVDPLSEKKYFLGSPEKAFAIMKKFGLGAKHEFISGHSAFPGYVLGRILVDVEDGGRAYYVYPKDRQAYYLGKPSDAFLILRQLSLGISNADIRRIEIGEIN